MRTFTLVSPLLLLLLTATGPAGAAESGPASQAAHESAQAASHASASAADAIVASGQVTSAAASVPLSVGGAVLGSAGAVSTGAAKDSLKAATSPIGKPLEVTEEAITTMPPNEALRPTKDQKSDKAI